MSQRSFPQEQAPLERIAAGRGADKDVHLARGILAARRGDLASSDRDLLGYIATTGMHDSRVALAYKHLGWNAALRGDYSRAVAYLQRIRAIDPAMFADVAEEAQFWSILRSRPALLVRHGAPLALPLERNLSGRIEARVALGGETPLALFDTGAEQCLISHSLAERLGLSILPGEMKDPGATGAINIAHVAVAPTLNLGGVELSNVPVEIMDDAALIVGPPGHRQRIDMYVGYAVLRLVGTVTIRPERSIAFGLPAGSYTARTDLLEEGFQPFARVRLFGNASALLLDTGASATILNRGVYDRHQSRFAGYARQSYGFTGVGGIGAFASVVLPRVAFAFAQGEVPLSRVRLLTVPSQFDVPGTVGNMGRDVFSNASAYFMDFRKHRLLIDQGSTKSQATSTGAPG